MHADRLGKYEIVRHLAKGGMASVYLARVSGEGGFERHVVLKTIADEQVDATLIPMFLDEARIVATLHHQHIAQVYEIGHTDGAYYLAMEYVHGETVRAVLETTVKLGQRLPLEFGVTVACAAASGLHHAHERKDASGVSLGIVHRDVTPSNVLVSYDGSIKVIDFGIAKAVRRKTRTATGFIKGKAGYMAPEQVKGYPVDRRSDVFALGVLAYETTTQKRAFHADSQYEQLQQIAKGTITPPSALVPRYPVELEYVVMRALELDPDERYPDANAFRTDLERVARGLGLRMGPDIITDVLVDLYGPRPEPWLMEPGSIDYDLTPPIADMPMSIEVIEGSERNEFSRGSDEQPAMRSPVPPAPRDVPVSTRRASSPALPAVAPRGSTPSIAIEPPVARRAPSTPGRAPSHSGEIRRPATHPGSVPIISIPEPAVGRTPTPQGAAAARTPTPQAPVRAPSELPAVAIGRTPAVDLATDASGVPAPSTDLPTAPSSDVARAGSPSLGRTSTPSSMSTDQAAASPAPSIGRTRSKDLAAALAAAPGGPDPATPSTPTPDPAPSSETSAVVAPRVKSPTSPIPSIVRPRTPTADSIAEAAAAAASAATRPTGPTPAVPRPTGPTPAAALPVAAGPSQQVPAGRMPTPPMPMAAATSASHHAVAALPSVVAPLPPSDSAATRYPRAAGTVPPPSRAATMRGDALPEEVASIAVAAKGTGQIAPLVVDARDVAGFAANPHTQPLELVDLEPVPDVDGRRRSTMSTRPLSRRAIYAASGVAAACALAITVALLTRGGGEATTTSVEHLAHDEPKPVEQPAPKHDTIAPALHHESREVAPPPPAPVERAVWAPVDGLAAMAWKIGSTRPPEAPKAPTAKVAATRPAPPRPPVARPAGKTVATVAKPQGKDGAARTTSTAQPKSAATTPGHVMLHVITDPPDSTVVLDGVRMGRTPFHAEVPARKEAWLRVRRFDRAPVGTRVVLDRDVSWQVKLPPKSAEPPKQASNP